MLERMEVLDLVLERKDAIRQQVTIILGLPDRLLLQLFIVPDHFFMLLLDGRLQAADHHLLPPDLPLQFLHIFGAANLLSFKQPYTAARQRIFPLDELTRLLEYNRSITVF